MLFAAAMFGRTPNLYLDAKSDSSEWPVRPCQKESVLQALISMPGFWNGSRLEEVAGAKKRVAASKNANHGK